jgi:penicillin-binding protein 1C
VPGITGGTAAAPLLFALHELMPRSEWYTIPMGALKTVRTCTDDGFLASDLCTARDTLVPQRSHFDRQSPYHQLVHVDAGSGQRVHAGCTAVSAMRHEPWFVLPPALAHYYRGGGHRALPAWRDDCAAGAADGVQAMMEFIYPDAGGSIYVPREMDGHRGRAVLEVVHRDPDALLYWHIDEEFHARTELRHQLAVDLQPGRHRVTVVDAAGRRLTRAFTVLSRDAGS